MQKKSQSKTGFTIIELLITITIIGILASITIVSYNGITTRANTSSAETAARAVAVKAQSYKAENGRSPLASSELTSDSSRAYYVDPATATFTSSLGAAPATTKTVRLVKCGSSPNSLQSEIVSTNITGVRVYYWTYSGTANGNSYVTAGNDVSAGVNCPAS